MICALIIRGERMQFGGTGWAEDLTAGMAQSWSAESPIDIGYLLYQ